MADRKSQSDHDYMVYSYARTLQEIELYKNVKADDDAFDSPEPIKSRSGDTHIPDITAEVNGSLIVFEVETEDTIDDPHTESQWLTFYEEAGRNFHIIVPRESKWKAVERVIALGIEVPESNIQEI